MMTDLPRKAEWRKDESERTDWTCVWIWVAIGGYLAATIAATIKYGLFGFVGIAIGGMGAAVVMTAFEHRTWWKGAAQLVGGLFMVAAGIAICGAGR